MIKIQELGEEDFSEEESELEKELGEDDELKEMSIDRLSALPESLLIHILSFLETKEAVETCVLSKRWQFLWTELPRLQFHSISYQDEEHMRLFLSSIHNALAIRGGNNLKRFEVEFLYDKCLDSDVNALVEFVGKNMVKEVGLLLDLSRDDYYMLPQIMYSNSSLTWLSLKGCIIDPQRPIMWLSLTTLFLENTEIDQHVIEKILSDCPVLDALSLMECWGFHRLEVVSQSVRTLRVDDRNEYGDEEPLEISAPYVHSLDISLCPEVRRLRLLNIPSVVSAVFDLNECYFNANYVEPMSNIKQLFESIQHVKKLELRRGCIKFLSKLSMNGWQLPQSTRGCLIIDAWGYEDYVSGTLGLLESSPNLENLVINRSGYFKKSFKLDPCTRSDLDHDLLHLKTVNIIGFTNLELASKPMLTLTHILLKRATVLEKMVIKERKVAQTLLSYPRSSQKAVVLFC